MKKIVIMPLDERPCNYQFNQWLADDTDYEIVAPPLSMLGNKKEPGDVEALGQWLLDNARDAYGVVVAVDTLLYSGIIPSRLHYDSEETLKARLGVLKKLRINYPDLVIYAYNLIMRNPRYSSSEEEPDYYEDWGRDIHRYGYIRHRMDLGVADESEKKEYATIEKRLPMKYWDDYLKRRDVNFAMNKAFLEMTEEDVIDFAIVPQDDSSPYGLTATDQIRVRDIIAELDIDHKAYMYPGADEVTNTLFARMINHDQGVTPKIKLHYTSDIGPTLIPPYEDRPLGTTVRYQVLAAGGMVSDSLKEADILLILNTPGEAMIEASNYENRGIGYSAFRNLIEAVETAEMAITQGKSVVMGDVAYANGGDPDLLRLLRQKKLLYTLGGYAGWNTSSNSLGTCIPQGMIHALFGDRKAHRDFLALRYIEDIGYCTFVRQAIIREELPGRGLSGRKIDGPRGGVAKVVRTRLQHFADKELTDPVYAARIIDSYQPWDRMFEVGLTVESVKR